jgi:hypothetical protein
VRLPGRLIRGPVRPDRASLARFASMRWAALPIVDRRWTAPMSAIALGFGLFVGVAIGPGAEGTLGTPSPMVVEVAPPADTQTAAVPGGGDGGGSSGGGEGQNGGGSQGDGGNGGPASSPDLGDLPSDPSAPVFDTPSVTPPVTTAPPPVVGAPADDGTTTGGGTTADEGGSGGGQEPADEEVAVALTGTVVHVNPAAASFTIATEDRRLIAIHSHKPPGIGREIEVEATQLANGTYVDAGKRDLGGLRGRAGFDGTVSFRDPVTGAYTVSAPGVSLLVRGGAQRTPPDVGARVEVDARIADNVEALPVSTPGEEGCGTPPKPLKPQRTALEQTGIEVADGERATSTDIETIVQGVCRDQRKLIVSADDLRESGRDLSIRVPKEIRIGALKPGQVLKLGAEIGDGAALRLTTVAGDEGKRGAENPSLVQSATAGESGKTAPR